MSCGHRCSFKSVDATFFVYSIQAPVSAHHSFIAAVVQTRDSQEQTYAHLLLDVGPTHPSLKSWPQEQDDHT